MGTKHIENADSGKESISLDSLCNIAELEMKWSKIKYWFEFCPILAGIYIYLVTEEKRVISFVLLLSGVTIANISVLNGKPSVTSFTVTIK